MKKIYTKTVFEFDKKTGSYFVNESESEFHYIADSDPITLMKGGGGSSGGTTTVTKTDPWADQQPYLRRGFEEAFQAFINTPPPQYYPGDTIAPFSPETQEAQKGILDRARAGSPLTGSMQDMLGRTLKGDYLYGGEGFNKALEAARNTINPMVDTTFERAGRGGSGLASVAKESALSDAFAKQYETERQNQFRAAGMAPGAAEMDYADLGKIAGVGREKDIFEQSKINENMQRYDYNQNARRNAILQYLNAIQGNYGSSVTSQTPGSGMSGWARYLAGAGGGALAGSAYGFPWGTAAGAGLGLLGAM